MKLTTLIILLGFLQVSAATYGQSINLKTQNTAVTAVFKELKKQTGYSFIYKSDVIKDIPNVNVDVSNASINETLDKIFAGTQVDYVIINKNVVIKRRETVARPVQAAPQLCSGKILDEYKQPLPAVTIKIKGTNLQTVSNAKGEFSIIAPDASAILQITSVGYERQEIPASKFSSPLTIEMNPSTSNLDQVQVTAYGTTSKRLNAGDITTITAKDIEKSPVNNVLEAIQGKVPGLFIQQATGQPGGAFTIRLRESANLFVGASPPLIIVDGVRYPGSTLPLSTNTSVGTQTFLQGGNGLNYINPNDIESIDVLKDADAIAIYGSSGAYGAVIITTKRAKAGAPAFNANIYTGVSINGETPQLLNTQQYVMLREEALKNDGTAVGAGDLDLNGTWPIDRYTDFRKLFMGGHAENTNINLNYSGGGTNSTYLISGSLRSIGNIQRHTGSDGDGSLRFALNTNTSDHKLSVSLTGTYVSSLDDMVPYDFSESALTPPNAPPPYNADGTLNWNAIGTNLNSSDAASNITRLYRNVTNNLFANTTLVYKPIEKLTFRVIFGYNDLSGKELIGYPAASFNPANTQANNQSEAIFHHYDTRAITIAPYAEFDTKLGRKGDLSLKAGGEADNTLTYYDDITGTGFPSDAFLKDPAAGSVVTTDYNLNEYRSIGTYTIIKYVWDDKYIIDLNGRRDGSTKFGPGRRFGIFGSVALAWIFSEEQFVKDNLPFLSFGKLRGSTGTVGGDNITNFMYLSTYSVVGNTYDGKIGLYPTSLYNPSLSWEVNHDSEIGLEMGFLHDRIYTEIDYYYNKAGNQLILQPLSTVTGFSRYPLNSDAVIQTSGFEGTLNTTNIKSSNFSWTSKFNISFPSSKLLKMPTFVNQNANYVLNKPVTGILLYKYNGVDPQTGYYSFTNAKGVTADYTGGLSQADKTQFVDLAPKFFGGFENTFSYKQLSFDFFISFTDRMGQNFLGQTYFPFGLFGLNGTTDWLRRWQKPGDVTDIPRVSANLSNFARQSIFQSSTGAYTNATYARLQNVNIRYRFAQSVAQKLHVHDFSIYVEAQNLLTVSKFGGLDPENLSAGVIPPLRTFTGGINVSL